jgi:hypothetical protein
MEWAARDFVRCGVLMSGNRWDKPAKKKQKLRQQLNERNATIMVAPVK